MVEVVPFLDSHAVGVAAVCEQLGWPSYADPAIARRGCTAPGVTTFVATDHDHPIGFAQVIGDGVVQGFLAQVGVLPTYRRRGIARRLVIAAFSASGVQRLDLLTDDAADFYQSFAHKEKLGFRIYPEASGRS